MVPRALQASTFNHLGEIESNFEEFIYLFTLILMILYQGFPYWPAKAMKASKENNVDVRFFGAHDRAWIPAKDCFLYR